MLALSFLVLIYNIVKSWRSGEKASADPWDARTLEWSIPSPPPEYNFIEIPVVLDRDDWWARKRRQAPRAVPVGGGSGYDEEHSIHLPQPSYWPIVVSIGLLMLGYGVIYNIALGAIGALIGIIGVYAWSFEPVNDPDEDSSY